MTDSETIERLMAVAKAVGYGEIPPYEHHVCFTTGAFDLIVPDSSDCGRIFQILEAVCQRYALVRTDPQFLSGYLHLLMQLVWAADTTEVPVGMKTILEENPSATTELREWYRIVGQ
jgi:hypothetical protein